MQIRYGLMLIKRNPDQAILDKAIYYDNSEFAVLHFVGYENQPSESDKQDLRTELYSTNFGITPEMLEQCEIADAPPDIVEFFGKIIKAEITKDISPSAENN